jgi:hypothetical protein
VLVFISPGGFATGGAFGVRAVQLHLTINNMRLCAVNQPMRLETPCMKSLILAQDERWRRA